MFFNENKRKRLHNNRVKFPEDLVGAPTWPPFLCLGHQHGGRDVIAARAQKIHFCRLCDFFSNNRQIGGFVEKTKEISFCCLNPHSLLDAF